MAIRGHITGNRIVFYNGPYNQGCVGVFSPKADAGILNFTERIKFPFCSYFVYIHVFVKFPFLPVICRLQIKILQ